MHRPGPPSRAAGPNEGAALSHMIGLANGPTLHSLVHVACTDPVIAKSTSDVVLVTGLRAATTLSGGLRPSLKTIQARSLCPV